MGTLTVAMFMTVDGYTETTDGRLISSAWPTTCSGTGRTRMRTTANCSATAARRSSSTLPTGPQPTAPTKPEDYRAFALTMNRLPKVALSDTLDQPGWNTTVEAGPLAESIPRE